MAVHRASQPGIGLPTAASTGAGTLNLTFDDGPSRTCTADILDVLSARHVTATFFILGKHVALLPGLVRRMVDEGHTVGLHGYSHSAFRAGWDTGALRDELERCQDVLWRAARMETDLYRAPMGHCMPWARAWLRRSGWTHVGWDVSARDWRPTDPHMLARRVARGMRQESVVLMHDGWPQDLDAEREATVRALPLVLNAAMERGLRVERMQARAMGGARHDAV